MREIDKVVGNNLRELRAKSGLKLDVVCEAIGYSRFVLYRLEDGRAKVHPSVLASLCSLYGCEPNVVFAL